MYGKEVIGPLDILYSGWTNCKFESIDTEDWLLPLHDKLTVIHDLAVSNESKSAEERVLSFNKGKSDWELEIGDRVLLRILGLHGSLQTSWEGPYTVSNKVFRVTYKVTKGVGNAEKLAHINNMKVFHDRPLTVNAITLVAEENGIDCSVLDKKAVLSEDKCDGYCEKELQLVLSRLEKFFSLKPGLCKNGQCKIDLVDGASPVNLPPRQVPGGIKESVKKEIRSLLNGCIIVQSQSQWASPLVPVRKKDGSLRLGVDFRALNALTPLKRFWLPSLVEILEQVGPNPCLSTLDLTSGFHQMEMDEPSSDLTTFVCPFGRYKYVKMPFGLKNAPAVFQEVVSQVLVPVSDISNNYIDDVIIYSPNLKQHLLDLEKVIICLGHEGLTLKAKKCSFGRKYLTYLGHKIGNGTISVPQARIKAMADYERPVTKKQLRSFLGSMSYYRKFVKDFAKQSSVLTPAVSLKAHQRVEWTSEMLKAFSKLRISLCQYVVLCIPQHSDSFVLHTDASGAGVGGCLHVLRDGEELPVAFYSRQLKSAEKQYSVTELESLAIVSSIKHFDYYVYGRPLTVITDHRACLALINGSTLNKRLLSFAMALQGQEIKMVHRPGVQHGNADGLSRQVWENDVADQDGLSASPPGLGLAGGDVGMATESRVERRKR